ncbi:MULTISPECIES: GNAT family N-acetyltransferase [unclassified Arthrobacter]|uniref:GNAT family N-acetyltransferase n=1 Tax=unclassified Arthrobacter TaxID=235627 RepID=UPI001E5AE288|nr:MULTISPECIES: GNAT family N-acetyltransferase [unclassified Arthrobacter]MCC9144517.1 GNAT family N-acetyltransferase [Arthrobacter sp. zg-Y919]MDK1275743.1 GNAT family N-acetyltransferase [Arthrobacter sp. zg.Y919]WIB02891.1 GNAT family N-acetyltransferase [Arthrobacter sp. zg-Y919]
MRQDPSDWTPAATEHLLLRRLENTDHDAAIRIHVDPRTNLHNPEPPAVDAAAKTLQAFLAHWEREGFGYWAVAERGQPETVIGFTGLQRALVDDREILNLYYRYDPAVWGRGYAKEGAIEAVRRGRNLLPELPVLARITASNIVSQRTAQAAGLARVPGLDRQYAGVPEVYFALGWPVASAAGAGESSADTGAASR